MSNVNNIKRAISNTFTAAVSIVAVSTEVLADTSGFVAGSISSTPGVIKETLRTPFNAAEGYLEAEGLGQEEAHAIAFKYLEQDAATTIAQAGRGAGSLVSAMFADLPEDDNNANTKEEDHRVA
jgi:hypothetical protein